MWQLFGALLAIVAAWSLIIIAALRVMFGSKFKAIDQKFEGLAETSGATSKKYQELERELLEFKADMPLEYVRREDFIRFEVGINYKLDKLRDFFWETLGDWQGAMRALVTEAFKDLEKKQ
jgi:hypothetical protein